MSMIFLKRLVFMCFCLALVTGLAACNGPDVVPTTGRGKNADPGYGKVFGKDLVLYRAGDDSDAKSDAKPGKADENIGSTTHNRFLWQASLDALSFMTISTADQPSGIIVTEWYSDKTTPDERFKFSIVTQGRELRRENLRIRLFKQVRDNAGNWVDSDADKTTATEITDTIMTRAHKLAHIAGEE
ncbi:MAG: DUF3576 domain-containing protein [Alphaproteobacteria bacterium]|nr:DUF3576 domain-containing protein [Alphaproteobacteria bacterium]